MPSYTAVYFLQGRLLGQSQFAAPTPPHSLAYFCSTCGEIWARIGVLGERPYWSIEHVVCEKHTPRGVPEWRGIPGGLCPNMDSRRSFLSTMWWGRALEHLPPAVLERELTLTLSHYERKLQEDITND